MEKFDPGFYYCKTNERFYRFVVPGLVAYEISTNSQHKLNKTQASNVWPLTQPEKLRPGLPGEGGHYWLQIRGKGLTIGKWFEGRHAKIIGDYQRYFANSIEAHQVISFRQNTGPIKRVHRQRRQGFRLPASTVCVTRETPWGNPFAMSRPLAVARFREWLHEPGQASLVDFAKANLSLYDNLACWCAPDLPCHADVWLEILNQDLVSGDLA